MTLNIGIDGTAASGKGTLADQLATHYGLRRVDAGLLYRELAGLVILSGYDLRPDSQVTDELVEMATMCASQVCSGKFEEAYLRSAEINAVVAITAKIPEARAEVKKRQKSFIEDGKGVVMDGRDITSVVMKNAADVMFFIDAAADVRAQRRMRQLQEDNPLITYQKTFEAIVRRDEEDRGRSSSPLVQVPDATCIMTDRHSINDTFAIAQELCDQASQPQFKLLSGGIS